MHIGLQIKKFRKLRRMSLAELAKKSRIQIATLSRIENGKMAGTLQCHINVAKTLGVSMPELFADIQPVDALEAVHPEPLTPHTPAKSKFYQEILTKNPSSKVMLPVLIELEPGISTDPQTLPWGTERFIYILEGEITVKIQDQTVSLTAKSSLYFNANLPHALENNSANTAKLLSVQHPVNL